jgi:PIN domain nuclease of toxin-antitoxin system
MNERYLLDTCALIWLSQGQAVSEQSIRALSYSLVRGVPLHVSSVSAWEVAMLISAGRFGEVASPKQWFLDVLADHQAVEIGVTTDLFIASCALPKSLHKDPMDRIIIATAREHDLTIITRDRAILSYGAAGHVKVLAC